jgi:ribosomal protein L29
MVSCATTCQTCHSVRCIATTGRTRQSVRCIAVCSPQDIQSADAQYVLTSPTAGHSFDGIQVPQTVSVPTYLLSFREELDRQRAQANYQRLHAEGKTEEARADLARLAIIKQQRAEAAKRREEEKQCTVTFLVCKSVHHHTFN